MTGRPKGSRNKVSFRNWQPKKWSVAYETILFLHLNGKTNVEISKATEYSEVQVGNILSSKLAVGRIEEIRKRIEEKSATVAEKLDQIMNKSIDRLYDYVHDDNVYRNTPNAAIDKTMKAIELARPPVKSNENTTNNTLILATEQNVGKLLEAMNMANKAKEINAGSYTIIPTTRDKAGVGDIKATG